MTDNEKIEIAQGTQRALKTYKFLVETVKESPILFDHFEEAIKDLRLGLDQIIKTTQD